MMCRIFPELTGSSGLKIEIMAFTKNDHKFFNKAKHAANISDYPKIHVGCVAVYHGSVVGVGYNCVKTHPLQERYNRYRESGHHCGWFAPKLHAEINCINSIRNLELQRSKIRLYIYRQRIDQDFGEARPCPSCMAAIRDFGIRDIYYTTDSGYCYERLAADWRNNAM